MPETLRSSGVHSTTLLTAGPEQAREASFEQPPVTGRTKSCTALPYADRRVLGRAIGSSQEVLGSRTHHCRGEQLQAEAISERALLEDLLRHGEATGTIRFSMVERADVELASGIDKCVVFMHESAEESRQRGREGSRKPGPHAAGDWRLHVVLGTPRESCFAAILARFSRPLISNMFKTSASNTTHTGAHVQLTKVFEEPHPPLNTTMKHRTPVDDPGELLHGIASYPPSHPLPVRQHQTRANQQSGRCWSHPHDLSPVSD